MSSSASVNVPPFVLTAVTVTNFKSYRGDVKLALARCGVNVICGSNGAGKSNALAAIVWALGYGGTEDVSCSSAAAGARCAVNLQFQRAAAITATVRCELKNGARRFSLWEERKTNGGSKKRGGATTLTRLRDYLARRGVSRVLSLFTIRQRAQMSADLDGAIRQATCCSLAFKSIAAYRAISAVLRARESELSRSIAALATNLARAVADAARIARVATIEERAAARAPRAAALRRAIAARSAADCFHRQQTLGEQLCSLESCAASLASETRAAAAARDEIGSAIERATLDDAGRCDGAATIALRLRVARLEERARVHGEQCSSLEAEQLSARELAAATSASLAAAQRGHADARDATRAAVCRAADLAAIAESHAHSRSVVAPGGGMPHAEWLRDAVAKAKESAAALGRDVAAEVTMLEARRVDARASAAELRAIRATRAMLASQAPTPPSRTRVRDCDVTEMRAALRRAQRALHDGECAAIELSELIDSCTDELAPLAELKFGSLERPVGLFTFTERAEVWLPSLAAVVGVGLRALLAANVCDASSVLAKAEQHEAVTVWDTSRLALESARSAVKRRRLIADAMAAHSLVDPLTLIDTNVTHVPGASAVMQRLFRNVLLCEDDATAASVLREPRFSRLELCTKHGVRHKRGVLDGGSQWRSAGKHYGAASDVEKKFLFDSACRKRRAAEQRVAEQRAEVAARETSLATCDGTRAVQRLATREAALVAATAAQEMRCVSNEATLALLRAGEALAVAAHAALARECGAIVSGDSARDGGHTMSMRTHIELTHLARAAQAHARESNETELSARALFNNHAVDADDASKRVAELAEDDAASAQASASTTDVRALLLDARRALEAARARTDAAQRAEAEQLAAFAEQKAVVLRLKGDTAHVAGEVQRVALALADCERNHALATAVLAEGCSNAQAASPLLADGDVSADTAVHVPLEGMRHELRKLLLLEEAESTECVALRRARARSRTPMNASELMLLEQQQREFTAQHGALRSTLNELELGSASVERRAMASTERGAVHIGRAFSAFFARLVPGKQARVVRGDVSATLRTPMQHQRQDQQREQNANTEDAAEATAARRFEVTALDSLTVMALSALSGGERTLLGMSWMLACASYRAAPFYLLDEIDAALDEGNQAKIAALVHSTLGATAQVVVISHHAAFRTRAARLITIGTVHGSSTVLAV